MLSETTATVVSTTAPENITLYSTTAAGSQAVPIGSTANRMLQPTETPQIEETTNILPTTRTSSTTLTDVTYLPVTLPFEQTTSYLATTTSTDNNLEATTENGQTTLETEAPILATTTVLTATEPGTITTGTFTMLSETTPTVVSTTAPENPTLYLTSAAGSPSGPMGSTANAMLQPTETPQIEETTNNLPTTSTFSTTLTDVPSLPVTLPFEQTTSYLASTTSTASFLGATTGNSQPTAETEGPTLPTTSTAQITAESGTTTTTTGTFTTLSKTTPSVVTTTAPENPTLFSTTASGSQAVPIGSTANTMMLPTETPQIEETSNILPTTSTSSTTLTNVKSLPVTLPFDQTTSYLATTTSTANYLGATTENSQITAETVAPPLLTTTPALKATVSATTPTATFTMLSETTPTVVSTSAPQNPALYSTSAAGSLAVPLESTANTVLQPTETSQIEETTNILPTSTSYLPVTLLFEQTTSYLATPTSTANILEATTENGETTLDTEGPTLLTTTTAQITTKPDTTTTTTGNFTTLSETTPFVVSTTAPENPTLFSTIAAGSQAVPDGSTANTMMQLTETPQIEETTNNLPTTITLSTTLTDVTSLPVTLPFEQTTSFLTTMTSTANDFEATTENDQTTLETEATTLPTTTTAQTTTEPGTFTMLSQTTTTVVYPTATTMLQPTETPQIEETTNNLPLTSTSSTNFATTTSTANILGATTENGQTTFVTEATTLPTTSALTAISKAPSKSFSAIGISTSPASILTLGMSTTTSLTAFPETQTHLAPFISSSPSVLIDNTTKALTMQTTKALTIVTDTILPPLTLTTEETISTLATTSTTFTTTVNSTTFEEKTSNLSTTLTTLITQQPNTKTPRFTMLSETTSMVDQFINASLSTPAIPTIITSTILETRNPTDDSPTVTFDTSFLMTNAQQTQATNEVITTALPPAPTEESTSNFTTNSNPGILTSEINVVLSVAATKADFTTPTSLMSSQPETSTSLKENITEIALTSQSVTINASTPLPLTIATATSTLLAPTTTVQFNTPKTKAYTATINHTNSFQEVLNSTLPTTAGTFPTVEPRIMNISTNMSETLMTLTTTEMTLNLTTDSAIKTSPAFTTLQNYTLTRSAPLPTTAQNKRQTTLLSSTSAFKLSEQATIAQANTTESPLEPTGKMNNVSPKSSTQINIESTVMTNHVTSSPTTTTYEEKITPFSQTDVTASEEAPSTLLSQSVSENTFTSKLSTSAARTNTRENTSASTTSPTINNISQSTNALSSLSFGVTVGNVFSTLTTLTSLTKTFADLLTLPTSGIRSTSASTTTSVLSPDKSANNTPAIASTAPITEETANVPSAPLSEFTTSKTTRTLSENTTTTLPLLTTEATTVLRIASANPALTSTTKVGFLTIPETTKLHSTHTSPIMTPKGQTTTSRPLIGTTKSTSLTTVSPKLQTPASTAQQNGVTTTQPKPSTTPITVIGNVIIYIRIIFKTLGPIPSESKVLQLTNSLLNSRLRFKRDLKAQSLSNPVSFQNVTYTALSANSYALDFGFEISDVVMSANTGLRNDTYALIENSINNLLNLILNDPSAPPIAFKMPALSSNSSTVQANVQYVFSQSDIKTPSAFLDQLLIVNDASTLASTTAALNSTAGTNSTSAAWVVAIIVPCSIVIGLLPCWILLCCLLCDCCTKIRRRWHRRQSYNFQHATRNSLF